MPRSKNPFEPEKDSRLMWDKEDGRIAMPPQQRTSDVQITRIERIGPKIARVHQVQQRG